MTDPLQAALVELRTRRDAMDRLIRDLETVCGVAQSPAPVVQAAAPRNGNGNGHTEAHAVSRAPSASIAILDYVRAHGPTSPRELEKRLRIEKLRLRSLVKQLATEGRVVVSGVTASRRVALPNGSGKEAP